ncbi:ATP-dependent RNA helicase HrpA [Agarivorans sp. Toyoura001]|uniref:ATP-dependent RNA helicase HrpA n=1 Tax=Agarivorans sp. Toyoura001 TaxID=2283141 RepID=UPI0010E401D0|nr:ATP-dependent RNA helicase HrpA [Agarivorans sp. Toyoura001]GDY25778.1 ATP-dependent RNA helicase HrpA [Agarivorans sp. Toyoura001]
MQSAFSDLKQQISLALAKDRYRLQRQLAQLKSEDQAKQSAAFEKFSSSLAKSLDLAKRRRSAIPRIEYPPQLPVAEQKQTIYEAIRDNQVVIIAGETGSGKTTQIPKICLELGLGSRGYIGHTQPRRLAARTVAARIAEEIDTPIGELVGYKIRFNDKIKNDSLIKLMTDGMLLAEMQQDRFLSQYEVLIIDEAHERSLNIDFILGVLRQLLPRRPDLKVIITSATIDPQRFSKHFNNAPVIEVSGRTYPVETRYRPLHEGEQTKDVLEGLAEAVEELYREKPGDILIFMNGEREIRDATDYLQKRNFRDTEVLPLYSRLSNAEQNKIFSSHRGRRIVLATNVAETSLTVPGIRYVIDPGTARISRYSYRSKVQRLPIEAISQASANQRKGRCGRVAEGICIRLYSEEDFEGRAEFTDPEILRTNLASVILQMLGLKLGKLEDFPFIDMPDQRNIKDGLNLLEEIGALKDGLSKPSLSPLGREVIKFPIDPRLARMMVAAKQFGCVQEMMVICAALSIQDPRERPNDRKQAADQKHSRFVDKDSDFSSYLLLWRYLQEQQKALSGNQFRKQCKQEFLAYMRIREWQDLVFQLSTVVKELDYSVNQEEANYDAIHQAITAGLLSHLGFKDKDREFLGARNARFVVFPGSSQAKKPPKWVVAAELVETSRLFARGVAKIQPAWLEEQAKHLIKKSYSEPHWSTKQQAVMAYESVRLYGVSLVNKRLVNYGRIDPVVAREVFIRSALVEAQWPAKHDFFKQNQQLLDDAEALEQKQRRRDVRVDDQVLFDFYAERIPEDVVSASHFNRWWKKASVQQADLLSFSKQMLYQHDASHITEQQYPEQWQFEQVSVALSYVFEPAEIDDGVSAHIPLALLNQLDFSRFDWQIPAFREELISGLIKSLPKPIRRNFVPVPNYVKAFLQAVPNAEGQLFEVLTKQLLRMTGMKIPEDAWNMDSVADHLKVNFKVIDDKGKVVAQGRSYQALQNKLQDQVEQSIAEIAPSSFAEQAKVTEWSFGELPSMIEEQRQGYQITAFPALVDQGKTVALKLFDKQEEASWSQTRGLSKLLQLNIPSPLSYLQQHLPNKAKLGLYFNPFGRVDVLLDDCCLAVIDKYSQLHQVDNPDDFASLCDTVRAELATETLEAVVQVEQILSLHYQINKQLKGKVGFDRVLAHADIKAQLAALVHKGFVREVGLQRLADVQRYLKAIERRLEKLAIDSHKDRLAMQQIDTAIEREKELALPVYSKEGEELRWMIEELRVSLFAQQLGTKYPVSLKRVLNHITDLQKRK